MAQDSCIAKTGTAAAVMGTAGGVFGAVHGAWSDQPVAKTDAMASLRRSFGLIRSHAGLFAAVGAVYAATECLSMGVRGDEGAMNAVIAGCVAGSIIGIKTRKMTYAVGGCASLAAIMGAAHMFDNRLHPKHSEPAPSYIKGPTQQHQ